MTYMDVNMHWNNGIQIYEKKSLYKEAQSMNSIWIKEKYATYPIQDGLVLGKAH